MSVTQQQAVSLLENVLFESATLAAANAASWSANPASTSVTSLAAAMAASPEESIAAHIVGYYLAALGRAPTADEVRFYVSYAEKGLTAAQIAAGQVSAGTWGAISSFFTGSSEFTGRAGLDYSLGATAALFEAVPWLYQTILGRAPGTAEITFYDAKIAAGMSLNQLFLGFTSSGEFTTDTGGQVAAALAAYGTAIASGEDPATIGSGITLGPPAPPPPAPTGPTIPASVNFTTGTDNFTALAASTVYNATLGGASPTLTANDSLHGAGAGNKLAITDTSGAASQDVMPSGVTLTNVTTITLTTSGNAGTDAAHPLDLSGDASLTSFTLTAAGSQGDYLKVGAGAALTIQTASATINILSGFADLAIIDNHLATLDLTGAFHSITLTDPTGPTSLAINTNGVSVSGVPFDSGTGIVTDASNHITSLTITETGAGSAFYRLSDTALTSLTLTGAVTAGFPLFPVELPPSLVTFNAANDTAGIYIALNGSGATANFSDASEYVISAGGNTITAGNGSNLINFGGTSAGGSITAGNGNNSVGLYSSDNVTVSLGNGGNNIKMGNAFTTSSGDTVTAGTGANTVSVGTGSGNETITLGNGNNTVTDSGSGGNTITLGTGDNTTDLGHNTTDIVKVGADAGYGSSATTPNLVVKHVGSGDEIVLSHFSQIQTEFIPGTLGQGGSPSGTIANLETTLTTNHTGSSFAYDVFGGDTFIVATASGTLGTTDTTIIQLVGYTGSVTWSGTDNILHLT